MDGKIKMQQNKKYKNAMQKLEKKIELSITPVPGFVIGLSGTDSILAFSIISDALWKHKLDHKLVGVHFANSKRKKSTWFEKDIIPWMRENWPNADIRVQGLVDNCEIERWTAIQHISKNETLWTAASVNATEKRLGKYTILVEAASLWPLTSFWKSEVLDVCRELGVPEIAIENSQIPDCLCGRDELAAQNIQLIDDILRFKEIDFDKVTPELYNKIVRWIGDTKKEYGFKERTPYTL